MLLIRAEVSPFDAYSPAKNVPEAMQPIKVWNLAKTKKLAEFAEAKRSAA